MTERILKAIEYNTLPKFVYRIEEKENLTWGNYEYDVQFIGLTNPKVWIQELNQRATIPLELSDEDMFTFFLLNNKAFQDFMNTGGRIDTVELMFNLSQDEARLLSNLFFRIYNDPQERQHLIEDIISERADFKAHFAATKSQYDAVQRTVPWFVSEFKELSKSVIYTLVIYNTLLGIFNSIQTRSDIQLVSVNNFYKIDKSYTGAVEYPDEEKTMFIYADQKRAVIKDISTSLVEPTFTLMVPDNAELVKKIIDILKPVSTVVTDNVVDGILVFSPPPHQPPKFHFNKLVWADIVMNNSIVSEEFVIDEHVRASKFSSNVYMLWIHKDKRIAFTVSEQSRYNVETGINEFTLQVRVMKVNNKRELLSDLDDKLRTFFGLYQDTAETIAKQYNTLLSLPIELSITRTSKPDTLNIKDTAPDLFVRGYSRACQFIPRIVSSAETKELEEKGYHVMSFPKDVDSPFLFSCAQHVDHVYPGLRVNHLSNKDTYKYLPCCYKEDQRKKKTNYLAYYGTLERDAPVVSRFIITDKILKFNQVGKLPPKILDFFSLQGMSVHRLGGLRDSGSILDCILSVTNEDYISWNEDRRRKTINMLRDTVSTWPDKKLFLIKQELWPLTIQQIKDIFKDKKKFLDASRIFSMLEREFRCRLVLFDKNGFKQPDFTRGFLRTPTKSEWPVVIIYENYGGEAEHAEYPQYELVKDVDSPDKIHAIYLSSLQTFTLDGNRAVPITYQSDEKATVLINKIEGQHMDEYGKVGALNVSLKGQQTGPFTFYPHFPIPPLKGVNQTSVIYPSKEDSEAIIDVPNLSVITGTFSTRAENEVAESLFDNFLRKRRESAVLIEHAKYLDSKFSSVDYKIGSPSNISRDKWMTGKTLTVSSKKVQDGLEYVVRLFKKQHPGISRQYKDLKYIPLPFETMLDFDKSETFIVSETERVVRHEREKLIQTPEGQFSFFLLLMGEVFFCYRISELITDRPITVYEWGTRKILTMENSVLDFIVHKTEKTGLLIYRMERVNRRNI